MVSDERDRDDGAYSQQEQHIKLPPCSNNLRHRVAHGRVPNHHGVRVLEKQHAMNARRVSIYSSGKPIWWRVYHLLRLRESLKFVSNFKFKHESRREVFAPARFAKEMDPRFFDEYLSSVDCSKITIEGIKEGTVVFPRVPLIHVSGPLGVTQLLETTLLTLINYASLVATNAARHRLTCGDEAQLLEFGLRRAQGVDGGVSASRYAYVGGFTRRRIARLGDSLGFP